MEQSITNNNLDFLSGGGEMGERIRNFDWSKTPLGNPETWESSLKTCVRIMLTSPQPMFVWWGDDLINVYNDAYSSVLGEKHPSALGISGKIVWKEIWEELLDRVKTVFEKNDGTFDDALLLIMNRNGYDEETYFKFSYNPIPGINKTTAGLFCVCTEETHHIINERALDTLRKLGAVIYTEKSLDIIYHNVADALGSNKKDFPFALIYKITGDANLVTVSASTGITKSQHVFPDHIDITKPTAITKDFCKAFTENKMVVSEIKANDTTLPTGAWQTVSKQFIHLPVSVPGSKHPYCIISAALNPHRRFDETYSQFCQLIADRVSIEINKMLALEIESKRAEALAEIDRAKIVFFSNISHEFRTPLTLMLSPLEEILNQKKTNLNETEKQNIEVAQRNALRLLKLVNTLLDFSNIEKGKHHATFSLVDLVALTKNLSANFRTIIEKAGMKLIVKADTITRPVYVDKQMWEKIIFNLLSNAFKYTLEGIITVELTAEKDFAVLKVKDTGVGIPEIELPKMFDRFHRIQNVAGRTYEGTGIGLSLVKELVQMHHGEISVDSVLNKGSVFTIKIPFGKEHLGGAQISRIETDVDEPISDIYVAEIETLLDKEDKAAVITTSVKENNNFPTVLVVDDNADMREHIRSLLSDNFNVILANNGLEALHKMKEKTPDLVLSDIMMPVMDGLGLLKEIKSNKATANIPVIFLTARASEQSKLEGWEMGADDYLVKPFSSKELIARVKAQIHIVKLRESLEGNMRSLFMNAPAIISVLQGPQHVIEMANKMYLQYIGKRDVLGKTVRDVFPELAGQGFFELLDTVYASREPFIGNEMPAQLDKGNGKLEEVYFNFVYQPTHNSEGEVDGIFVHGVDVTEQVLSRKKNEENGKRQAFLLRFSDAIRPLSNPVDIEEAVTKIALDFMDADRCYYSTIEGDNVIILRDAVRGNLPSIAGVYSIGNFALYKAVLNAGQPFVVDDVRTSNLLDEDLKKVCLQYQYGSFINVPVIKNGKSVGLFSLVENKPRKWTDLELQLTIETAERTWAAVERAKAEEELRQSEEKYRTLFNSIDQGFVLGELIRNEEGKGIDYRVHQVNPTYEKQTGISIEMVLGKSLLQAFPTIDKWWIETYAAVVDNQTPVRFEKFFEFTNRWFDIKASPAGNEMFTILFTDITERKQAEEKIKESESRFRTMADVSPVLIWTLDANGLSSYYNKTFLDFIGVSTDEGILAWNNIVHPDDIQSTSDTINTAIAERQSFSLECRLLRADGQWRWVFAQGNPRMGANNEFLGFVGSSIDITERKLAEEKIAESEKQFSTLANNIQNLAWIADSEGWIYWYNQRWYDYTGTTLQEMEGWGWQKMHHPEHIERVVDFVKQAWQKNEPFELIFPLRGADGNYRRFLTRVFPVNDAEGHVLRWVGTNTDIEEQETISEQLEEKVNERTYKLKQSEEKFNKLFAASPLGLVLSEVPSGVIIDVNEIYCETNGYSKEECIGKTALELNLMDKEDHQKILNELLQKGFIKNVEIEITKKNGDKIPVLTSIEKIHIADKEYHLTALIDITDRKKAERKIEEKNFQLEKINKELEAFTYISSHDLQEPLRKIQTFAGRIIEKEKDHLSENAKDYFNRMNAAALRMQTLIKDLLTFSRVSASENFFELTDLSTIVSEVKEELKEVLKEKNATITIRQMCELNIIPFQFRQLMHNLIGNALKFSKPDVPSHIIIKGNIEKGNKLNNEKLLPEKTYCHITVADNGIGFEKHFSEKIFGVFQKLHGKHEYAGTGIGLAIVKKIVDNHNGIITAESELDKGATFNIYLPV